MTTENEVSKEVVAIEGKCGSEMSSSQDLPSPDCNGVSHRANGPDNSYVFVTGDDGLSDDPVDCKEENVVALETPGLTVNPEAVVVQIGKLDILNGELTDSVKEVKIRNVEANEVTSVVDGICLAPEQKRSPEDEKEDIVTVVDAPEEQDGKTENCVISEIKPIEDSNGRLESRAQADIETVANHSEKLENVAESEIEQVEDTNGRLESSVVTEMKVVNDQDGNLGNVALIGTELVEDPSERIENFTGAEIRKGEHQNEKRQDESKSEIRQVEDSNGTPESLEVTALEIAVDPNLAANEIEQVEDSKERFESLGGAEIETVGNQNKKIEYAAETEIKQVDDPNGKVESTAGAKIEKVADQNIQRVAETELQKFEDRTISASSPVSVENQKSQVGDSGLFTKQEKKFELNNPSLSINEPGNENVESENQYDFDSTRTSETCQGSQNVVEDPVESKLQKASSKVQNEIVLAKKLVETVRDEVPPATSLVSDIEAHPVNNNEETLEEQANIALVLDVIETVVGGNEGHTETVCEVIEETYEKDISISHVVDFVQNDEPPKNSSDGNGVSYEAMRSETKTEASLPTPSLPVSYAHEFQSGVDMSGAETDGPKSQIVETVPSDHESQLRGTITDAGSESDSVLGMVVTAETEPTFLIGDADVETEVSSVKTEVFNRQPASFDVKSESKVHNSATARNEETTSDVTAKSRIVNDFGLDVYKNSETIDVEDIVEQLDSARGSTDGNLCLRENKDNGNCQSDNISVASPVGSSTDVISAEEISSTAAVTKPFNYLMKVPRFNDESLKEQIRHAKLQVEEKTKLRDAIQLQIHQIRANSQIHGVDYEYAKGKIRNARKLLRSKRMEIDSLHYLINKAKNAISIDDIDTRIYSVEHMIQHETLPLKEEKQFIREIKQLKGLRDELSANIGSEEEINQALEQREESEERTKILRKELAILKGEILKTEAAAMEAGRKYEDEIIKLRELQTQFRVVNEVRQEAYARWLSIRKELSVKNKHFFKYKDDLAAANNYALSRDTASLYRLCTDQVENLMELWNTDEEFRKDYVSFNVRSTVRRLRSLDGRALGPDEEPPILPSYVDERVHMTVPTPVNVDSVSQGPLELKLESNVENGILDDKSLKKENEQKNQAMKSKKAAEPLLEIGLAAVSSWDVADEVECEPVKSREEVELDRKAEEMRRKEEEDKLKEQRRLEGLAKANEARERKKRQAEKVQMRAELKARKEAEEKEKEREKRLRKKEKKKAATTDSNDSNNNSDSAPSSESAMETGRDIDAKDLASTTAKKPYKNSKKQNKKNNIPPALRNKNRKRWQQYAYVTIAGILAFVLFWVGNVSVFWNKTLKRPNPVY